jgi:hypothetical protein
MESKMNKPDGTLPFGLYNPESVVNGSDPKVTWLCDHDKDGKITSIYLFSDGGDTDRQCRYLPDLDTANQEKNILIDHGWLPLKTPTLSFSYKDDDGTEKPMNRAQRRALEKKIQRAQKNNPFQSR